MAIGDTDIPSCIGKVCAGLARVASYRFKGRQAAHVFYIALQDNSRPWHRISISQAAETAAAVQPGSHGVDWRRLDGSQNVRGTRKGKVRSGIQGLACVAVADRILRADGAV
ncbi:hypothetical protein VP1G_07912 [Cytospora mali]|uniref:Uncharacterized protein n=1 Tax=Cytospora mali TaxID=578113 RepID=A0A194V9T3_CYTMA|nr:hypothetical protein VP1G_07912 [Valsa mali var. pyri (nom. inval.)]